MWIRSFNCVTVSLFCYAGRPFYRSHAVMERPWAELCVSGRGTGATGANWNVP